MVEGSNPVEDREMGDPAGGRPAPDLETCLKVAAEAVAKLGERPGPARAAEIAVGALAEGFGASRAELWLCDAEAGSLALAAVAGPDAGPPHPGPGASVLADGTPSGAAEAVLGRVPEGDGGGSSCSACLPLVWGDRLLGVLCHRDRQPVPEGVAAALRTFAAAVAAALRDFDLAGRARAALNEAEWQGNRLRTILDVLAIGVILVEGPEGRVTLANPAAQAISGEPIPLGPLNELLAQLPLAYLDGHPVPTEERPLWRSLHRGERVRQSFRLRRRDGREAVLEIATAPIPGPGGGAVSTFWDATDEQKLRAELGERAAQFKALLDHLPVGVAYFDDHGVCRAANGPARRILGRSRGAITGAAAADLFAGVPELRDALDRCLREHSPHAQQAAPWAEGTDGSSDLRHLDWQFEPLPVESGRPAGVLALIVDVTARKQAEDRLTQAMQAAERASRGKTQFLSAVSHDLRTPVNALSLQAELLSRIVAPRDDPGGELRLLAHDIRQAASVLIDLVNDLLDLTRFDSGDIDYQRTEFVLEQWLSRTLNPLEVTARAKGLDFKCWVDRPGRVVRGDPVKLARILINLAGNAIKFTDQGTVEIAAGAGLEGWLAIAVRDTGSGIPEDQLGRIFDEFAQLRNPERDRTKGTGLGLAICRRLVEAVGGRLTVESRLGEGSLFTALFPPDHLPDVPPAPPASALPSMTEHEVLPPALPAGTILLVEDDPFGRKSLARLLERSGYTIVTAASGPEALEAVATRVPALVLLDLMLPGMDGAEVLNRLRASFSRTELPVVVLTGDVLSGRSSELHAMDVVGMLPKPVDLDDLLAIVARFVRPSPPAGAS